MELLPRVGTDSRCDNLRFLQDTVLGRVLIGGQGVEAGQMRVLQWALIALPLLACASWSRSAEWFKGNTHTHSKNSGGDSSPEDVVRWYHRKGYNFVFITDHEMVTDVDPLNGLFGAADRFLVIRGEEVSSNFAGPAGKVFVHVNSLNPRGTSQPSKGGSARETLQANVDAIRAAGGLAQINHPNFMWQLNASDLGAVKGARLLEIMNMHPLVNTFGAAPTFPGAEELWDQALSRGALLWGVASDDMHDLEPPADGEQEGAPGKGWIMVRAEHLTTADIMRAIDQGDFYASTGVTLKDYKVEGSRIVLEMQGSNPYLVRYRTRFIGKGGVLLQDSTDTPAIYAIKGTEGYVRARVDDSNGRTAWTQPVFVPQR